MQVEDVMSANTLTISPEVTLREAAQQMSERNAGAAVVANSVGTRPGIITERDVLDCVAAGLDPETERVADNLTPNAVSVAIDASLERAVEKMMEGAFRHLLVAHGDEVVGIVSMRDLVRALATSR